MLIGQEYNILKEKYVIVITNAIQYKYRSSTSFKITGKVVDVENTVLILDDAAFYAGGEESLKPYVDYVGQKLGKKASLEKICRIELGNIVAIREIKLEDKGKVNVMGE